MLEALCIEPKSRCSRARGRTTEAGSRGDNTRAALTAAGLIVERVTMMIEKLKARRRQKKYTKWHRQVERADTFRLMSLNNYIPPTYGGRRPWCDAVLQECPVPGHDLCCFCTHSEKTPEQVMEDRRRDS